MSFGMITRNQNVEKKLNYVTWMETFISRKKAEKIIKGTVMEI